MQILSLKKKQLIVVLITLCVCVLTILVASTENCVRSHHFIQCEETVSVQLSKAAQTAGDRTPSISWAVGFTQTLSVADPAGDKTFGGEVCQSALRITVAAALLCVIFDIHVRLLIITSLC